jgi:hypothetical protein
MPPQPSPSDVAAVSERSEPGRLGPGVLRLAVCTAAAALLWLLILPQLSDLPVVRTTIDRNNALGIDPSAKFYSELPAMPRIIEQLRDDHRHALIAGHD